MRQGRPLVQVPHLTSPHEAEAALRRPARHDQGQLKLSLLFSSSSIPTLSATGRFGARCITSRHRRPHRARWLCQRRGHRHHRLLRRSGPLRAARACAAALRRHGAGRLPPGPSLGPMLQDFVAPLAWPPPWPRCAPRTLLAPTSPARPKLRSENLAAACIGAGVCVPVDNVVAALMLAEAAATLAIAQANSNPLAAATRTHPPLGRPRSLAFRQASDGR